MKNGFGFDINMTPFEKNLNRLDEYINKLDLIDGVWDFAGEVYSNHIKNKNFITQCFGKAFKTPGDVFRELPYDTAKVKFDDWQANYKKREKLQGEVKNLLGKYDREEVLRAIKEVY